jgi:hypothetical protein
MGLSCSINYVSQLIVELCTLRINKKDGSLELVYLLFSLIKIKLVLQLLIQDFLEISILMSSF